MGQRSRLIRTPRRGPHPSSLGGGLFAAGDGYTSVKAPLAAASAARTSIHSTTVRFPFESPHGRHAGALLANAPTPPRENGTM